MSLIVDKTAGMKLEVFSGKQAEWSDWRERFEAVMAINKMLDVLVLDNSPPEDPAKRKEWDEMSAGAYSRLVLFTTSTPLGLVKKYRSTRDGAGAWRAMVDKYELKGEVRISFLHDQLFNSVMSPSADPEVFFLQVEELQQRLGELQVIIVDATLKSITISKLPPIYEPLRAVIDTIENLSYEKLKDHVRGFYDRNIAGKEEKSEGENHALNTNSTGGFRGRCYKCGIVGHTENVCRRPRRAGSDPRKCHGCGKSGHLVRNCPEQNGESSANVSEVL